MYLQLHEGDEEDSYLEIQKTSQLLSPNNLVCLFEFWDSLFLECGRLICAADHFRNLYPGISVVGGNEEAEPRGESRQPVVDGSLPDENFFLTIGQSSVFYGEPRISPDLIAGEFESDSSILPNFLPAIQLFGSLQPSPESHPQFYGHIEQVRTEGIARPRVAVEGSRKRLCKCHEDVEAILCVNAKTDADTFRRLGASAREIVMGGGWSSMLNSARNLEQEARSITTSEALPPLNLNWINARLSSDVEDKFLLTWSAPNSTDKLSLKLLAYSWYCQPNDRKHPSQIADELWRMLADNKPSGERPKYLKDGKSAHDNWRVFEDAIYQLTQKVPGLPPAESWERNREQLVKLGINSRTRFDSLLKYARQRSNRKNAK